MVLWRILWLHMRFFIDLRRHFYRNNETTKDINLANSSSILQTIVSCTIYIYTEYVWDIQHNNQRHRERNRCHPYALQMIFWVIVNRLAFSSNIFMSIQPNFKSAEAAINQYRIAINLRILWPDFEIYDLLGLEMTFPEIQFYSSFPPIILKLDLSKK